MLQSEIVRIAKQVQETKNPTVEVIHKLFPTLSLSEQERIQLQKEALSSRVNQVLTSGSLVNVKSREVKVEIEPCEKPISGGLSGGLSSFVPEKIDIDVRILHDVIYDVNGKRVAVIDMHVSSVSSVINSFNGRISGMTKTREFFVSLRARLKELNKTKVSDLARGEQTRFARQLENLKRKSQLISV